MTIFMGIIALLLLIFFGYQLYERYQLDNLDSDSQELRNKLIVYKYQRNHWLLTTLLIGFLIMGALLIGILYRQQSLITENQQLKKEMNRLLQHSSQTSTVQTFQGNEKTVQTFPWQQLVKNDSMKTLKAYEVQLAKAWQPFLGNTTITILKSQRTEAITLSLFSSLLTVHDYQIVLENINQFVQTLNSVKQVTMIDFHLMYADDSENWDKQSLVFSRPSQGAMLEEVVLDEK